MHTVERLEQALRAARQRGFTVRQEWLDGVGGGACEFAGKKWLFVDLALSTTEQLAQVTDALRQEAPHTTPNRAGAQAKEPSRRAA